MKNPNDLRAVKTKDRLIEALILTLQENSKVFITDICRKAGIRHETYYNHFNSKEQLIEATVKEQLFKFLPIPNKLKPSIVKHLIIYLSQSLSLFFINNKKLIYNALLSKNQYIEKLTYIDCLNQTLRYLVQKEFDKLIPPTIQNKDLITDLVLGGILSIIYHRLESKQAISSEMIMQTIKYVSKTMCE